MPNRKNTTPHIATSNKSINSFEATDDTNAKIPIAIHINPIIKYLSANPISFLSIPNTSLLI